MRDDLGTRRIGPFVVAGAVVLIVCSAVAALPDPYLRQLMRGRLLDGDQAGWAYRLLVLFASIEIVYAGYRVFRVEAVAAVRGEARRGSALTGAGLISSMSRTAAVLVTFTLLYGLASIWLTGQRGGFWLFPVLAVAQLAWYYRAIGDIGRWEQHQQPTPATTDPQPWPPPLPDYCPPIARGLTKVERVSPTAG